MRESRDFGFRDQITRAAVSVPSNIAEGVERNSKAEFKHFLGIAKGSAGELRTQITIARELEYLADQEAGEMLGESVEISRMLHGLIRSLKKPEAS